MSQLQLLTSLVDQSNNPITSMGASWTSKTYAMGENLYLCGHFMWSLATITGVLYMDYSATPYDGTNEIPDDEWVSYNAINLDGTISYGMFLDAAVPVMSVRFRYVRSAGTATLKSRIVRKRR